MSSLDPTLGLGKTLGGVFYLHGEDHFRKEASVRALVEAHLDPATRDFNYDPLRGTEVDGETLASVLATPPMMAEWRVVVLREVEGLASTKKARDELLAVAQNPPPGLALVMSCTVPSGSKAKFYRDLAKHARSVEFRALSESDVPGWLMDRAEEVHGVRMEPEAAQALGAAIGTDLGVLSQEMEKLAQFVGDRESIGIADIEAAGTRLPSQDRWRWFDLVGERKFQEARGSLTVLLGQGETGVGLVIGLTTHFLRLGIAAEKGAGGLEAALPRHQKWLAKRVVGQARKWSAEEIDEALDGLRDVDRLLKASPHTDEHFLESWILGLHARAEAA
ncbi:MAG: DNA polymerase III subunit delta [Longimicrobiales bacterium]|nr:DNA polymerase III subunit delta [Longimicrobiales bacterium]